MIRILLIFGFLIPQISSFDFESWHQFRNNWTELVYKDVENKKYFSYGNCNGSDAIIRFYKVNKGTTEEISDASTLNPNITTFIIIHGWTESYLDEDYQNFAEKLSVIGNTILIDSYDLLQPFYGTCGYYMVETLGNFVAAFIADQINTGYLNPSLIHIIGHSLGGQAAGRIGREVINATGKKIKRISALDPAGPLFNVGYKRVSAVCLGPTDAEVVDVLHTSNSFGGEAVMGTVDFYALGLLETSDFQPACGIFSFKCSHNISKKYFLESIDSCGFVATSNATKKEAFYGLHMSLNTTGVYTFTAKSTEPFAGENVDCP